MPSASAAPDTIHAGMTAADYERAVVSAVTAGRVPSWQTFVPVAVSASGRTGVFYASAQPLTIGTDAAPFHAPVSAQTAQRIADAFGYLLPTRKMVDAIHAAGARVPFRAYTSDRQSVATYLASSAAIEGRRAGRTGLVTDYAKDYVLSNARRSDPRRIVIYGAWDASGALVQPKSTAHAGGYYDYSQQPRFVLGHVVVDGQTVSLVEALTDPTVASLFSDEGTISRAMLRY